MTRKLGSFEHAAAFSEDHSNFKIIGTLRVQGPLTPEVLQQAFARLQQRHPILRVRIIKQGRHYYFDPENTGEVLLRVIERESDTQWMAEAEHALNADIGRIHGPLLHCSFLHTPGGDRHDIILCFHHAITDAASAARLIEELLGICGALITGEPAPELPERAFPPPADDLFPRGYHGLGRIVRTLPVLLSQMADEVSYRWQARRTRKAPIMEQARGCVLPVVTDEDLTGELVRRCRRERVTVNSALNAAMLLAVWEQLYGLQPGPLRFIPFASLRPHLVPPVPETELGCYISMGRFTVLMGADRGFWDLARDVNERVYRFGSSGDKFIASVLAKSLMAVVFGLRSFRMATIAISYPGPLLIDRDYGPLYLRELHAFVSNFGLGPEYTAQVRLMEGRLWWDIVYLDTDMNYPQAKEIANKIHVVLAGAVRNELASETTGPYPAV
jgi:hypothetical protein